MDSVCGAHQGDCNNFHKKTCIQFSSRVDAVNFLSVRAFQHINKLDIGRLHMDNCFKYPQLYIDNVSRKFYIAPYSPVSFLNLF